MSGSIIVFIFGSFPTSLRSRWRLVRLNCRAKLLFLSSISSSQMKPDEATRLQQEELDIKCLQLLRAIIHNEIVKLPENWEENPHHYRR